ncbi:MAG: DUF4251 domain-containing protein [Bacteroides sp.]|jgi:hypothetical protein|nr:DUF4251 domain-containing protein [Bacteroides sp.]MCI1684059.1 DUF4251 domain-containing protein [Bacteroides sp.]
MKTVRFLALLLLIGVANVTALSAQTKQEKKEQKTQAIKELVMSQKYKIDVDRALPLRGRAVSLTSPYSLEIRNDSVISYLPYYGRAYSIPYGGGNGLNFKAPITGYQVEWNKKGTAKITFTARNPEDRFDFYLDIYTSASSTIVVNMQNRQSISFEGNLDVKE